VVVGVYGAFGIYVGRGDIYEMVVGKEPGSRVSLTREYYSATR
jgi:hypothetical protein